MTQKKALLSLKVLESNTRLQNVEPNGEAHALVHMLDQGYECMHLPKQGLETMKIEQITKCTRLHESKSKIQHILLKDLVAFSRATAVDTQRQQSQR